MVFFFDPPLERHLHLYTSETSLSFCVIGIFPDGFEPEIWTSLPSGIWHAVRYTRMNEGAWWEAHVDMTADFEEGEFTYRLRRGDEIWWLGNVGGNGKVVRTTAKEEDLERKEWTTGTLEECIPEIHDMEHGMILQRTKPTWYEPVVLSSSSSIASLYQNPTEISLMLLSSSRTKTSVLVFPHPPAYISSLQVNGNATIVICRSNNPAWNRILAELLPGVNCEPKLHGLNYCTWNSLGVNFRATDVVSAVKSLPFVPSQVLIDDGWSDTSTHQPSGSEVGRLRSFNTAHEWGNLKDTVQTLKRHGVERVGVWINALGYWGGLDDTVSGKFPLTAHTNKNGVTIKVPVRGVQESFWDQWFCTIKDCGIDFIKLDNLAAVDQHLPTSLVLPYTRTLFDTVNRHFSRINVYCMPHSSSILSLLLPNSIVRTSDDFLPLIQSSHPWHIYSNAIVSLLFKPLGFQPDFDMFQTLHPFSPSFASYHASFRAFSPAPVWITDKTGNSDSKVISRLLSKTMDGVKVLQLKEPGKIPDKRVLLDLHNGEGGGVLILCGGEVIRNSGFWNVRKENKEAYIIITREMLWNGPGIALAYLSRGEKWILIEESRGKTVGITSLHLKEGEYEIGTASKLWEFESGKVACLGLKDKFVGGRAVSSICFENTEFVTKPSRLGSFNHYQHYKSKRIALPSCGNEHAPNIVRSESRFDTYSRTARVLLGRIPCFNFLVNFIFFLWRKWHDVWFRYVPRRWFQPGPIKQTTPMNGFVATPQSESGKQINISKERVSCLAIELEFIGDLLFWVSNNSKIAPFRVSVDGLEIDPSFIKLEKENILHGTVWIVDLVGWLEEMEHSSEQQSKSKGSWKLLFRF